MCNSRKHSYPTKRRLTEVPRGKGVSNSQFFFKGNYDYHTKPEFPDGVGVGLGF